MLDRRGFLTGIVGVLAAPAIVKAGVLMPVKSIVTRDRTRDILDIHMYLQRLKAQREIYDYTVVCHNRVYDVYTQPPPIEVDVYIKPVLSLQFVEIQDVKIAKDVQRWIDVVSSRA